MKKPVVLMTAAVILALLWPAAPQAAAPLPRPVLRLDRARSLAQWRGPITEYSRRHYGEATWKLHPTCIVLHYTAGREFPWNLVRSKTFAGERPGLASHYVIDGRSIWQILPPTVRSRGAYGINHRAVNIEMVAADAADLQRRSETLRSCAGLLRSLTQEFGIARERIYSHADVARMDRRVVPEVLDLVNPAPYQKIDPGAANMQKIRQLLDSGKQE